MQVHNTFVLNIFDTTRFFTNTHNLYLKAPKTSAKGKYLMVYCHDNITWLPFNILFLMKISIVAFKIVNRRWNHFKWIIFPNTMSYQRKTSKFYPSWLCFKTSRRTIICLIAFYYLNVKPEKLVQFISSIDY